MTLQMTILKEQLPPAITYWSTSMNNLYLAPRLQKLVDMGESGTDILHGELKNLMHETETKLSGALRGEGYEYLEGMLDAYINVYQLTYHLAFAISDRAKLTNQ